jgi:hypothetical protein
MPTVFCATLDISDKTVRCALKKKGEIGAFSGEDQRGKQVPKNKTANEDLDGVRRHIDSFPAMESHYCRKDSARKYLDSGLSIRKMVLDLYPAWCEDNGYNPVKENVYRNVFTKEYNLGFHAPKKDLCLTCAKYENLVGEAKDDFRAEYELHQQRKVESNTQKEEDKQFSNTRDSYHGCNVVSYLTGSIAHAATCHVSNKPKILWPVKPKLQKDKKPLSECSMQTKDKGL